MFQNLFSILRRLGSRFEHFREPALDLYSNLRHLSKRRSSTFSTYIRKSHNWRLIGTASLLALLTLSGLFIAPLYFKDVTRATIGTANAADTTLTVSSDSNKSSVALDVTSPTGTFASSSDSTSASFSVTSNNYTGYTLSISPASTSQTNVLSTPTGATFEELPNTVTADNFSSNTSLNNKWGYTFYKSGSSATNYYPGSTTNNKIDETSSANSTANIYYIGLGVRASYTQAAGTYDNSTSDNSYILTATGNASPLVINFMRNDGTTTTFYTQTESTTATSTTLYVTKPTREHYSFINWCLGTTTTTNGVDSCNGTIYSPGATFGIDQTISNQNITLNAMWKIDTFTCTKRYRLQNADGTFPSSYTSDSSTTVNYGGSCSYSKTVTDYKANGGTNNSQASASASNISSNQTLSLDFYRNTFTLTVNAGTNTSTTTINSVSKTTYTARWGEAVTVGVTKTANATCISYTTPTWKVSSGTTGSFSSTSGASVTYTMPKGNSAVSASSTASNVAQTITFKTSNANGITLNGNYRTNNQTLSINCGTYNISGSYPDNYEFSSWSATAGSFASSASASTTYTVSGPATVTLTGKESKIYMQNMTYAQCTTTAKTVYDDRDETAYVVQRLADNTCWMLDNLALYATARLTSSDTNLSSSWSLPSNVASGFNSYTAKQLNSSYATDTASYAVGQSGNGKIGVYYNYCAASAGTICAESNSSSASYDICPKGWRMPTGGNGGGYQNLRRKYSWSGAFASALRLPLSGQFGGSVRSSVNYYGYWWSSTYHETDKMYFMSADYSDVTPVTTITRNFGLSMRCVLKATS